MTSLLIKILIALSTVSSPVNTNQTKNETPEIPVENAIIIEDTVGN